MCLDSDTSEVPMPDSMSKTALQSLHGFNQNFENRWFDKTLNVSTYSRDKFSTIAIECYKSTYIKKTSCLLQFFVGSSGENGCISEHTPADGVVVMKIADHAMSYM